MPQFDFHNVFLPQFVWLLVFFAILYFGIVRLTLPKIGNVMQQREDKVTGDLDAAETSKVEADAVAQAYQAEIATAQEKARTAVASARSEAQRAIEKRLAAADGEIAQRQEAAAASLADARSSALAQLEGIAADAAADIVERLTGIRPAEADAATAAKTAMAGA